MATTAQKRRVMKARKVKGWAAKMRAWEEAEARKEKQRKGHEKTFTELRIDPDRVRPSRLARVNAWRVLDPDDFLWATPAQWSFYLAALADPHRPMADVRAFVLAAVLRARAG